MRNALGPIALATTLMACAGEVPPPQEAQAIYNCNNAGDVSAPVITSGEKKEQQPADPCIKDPVSCMSIDELQLAINAKCRNLHLSGAVAVCFDQKELNSACESKMHFDDPQVVRILVRECTADYFRDMVDPCAESIIKAFCPEYRTPDKN